MWRMRFYKCFWSLHSISDRIFQMINELRNVCKGFFPCKPFYFKVRICHISEILLGLQWTNGVILASPVVKRLTWVSGSWHSHLYFVLLVSILKNYGERSWSIEWTIYSLSDVTGLRFVMFAVFFWQNLLCYYESKRYLGAILNNGLCFFQSRRSWL